MKARVVLSLVLIVGNRGLAQDSLHSGTPRAPGWPGRKIAATAAVGGILVGSLISSYFDWWKDSAQPFHIVREGIFSDYSLGIDKIGHAYTSYFYFNTFRNVMLWGGYGESTALWWAAGTTAFFALSIEIGDGVSPYGFSFEDLAFNMGGLGLGMLRTAVPFLRSFDFKWSYVPREGYRWPPRFTDHYDAHTYWLTVNMHRLLPESIGNIWPEFLQLAVGYGVDDNQTRREGVLGLDFNLEIFPVSNPELRLLQETVDMIHIPAPAVKYTEGKTPKYYLFHTD
jgi:hypothetical protein